jgi:hypothetical protein
LAKLVRLVLPTELPEQQVKQAQVRQELLEKRDPLVLRELAGLRVQAQLERQERPELPDLLVPRV